jgi:hypothetical protein
MEKLKMQPWDVAPFLAKIRFKERQCSDGQCCSYNLDDPDFPKKILNKYYWILEYKKNLRFYSHRLIRAACPDLEVDFSEDKGMLSMGTSCRNYFHRPQECRDFGSRTNCNYREYVENTKEEHYYSSLFLLVLQKNNFLVKYPFLVKFDLAGVFPQLPYSMRGTCLSNGLYIPMPADEKMLPNPSYPFKSCSTH